LAWACITVYEVPPDAGFVVGDLKIGTIDQLRRPGGRKRPRRLFAVLTARTLRQPFACDAAAYPIATASR
jgi:hypothetical protein